MESKGLVEVPADRGERGQSRGGARGGKPNLSGNDSGLGGASGALSVPNLDAEINRYGPLLFVNSVFYFLTLYLLICSNRIQFIF